MSSTTVLTLVGSLRAGSTNAQLAEAIQLNAPEQVEVVIHDSLGDIPFYNEDIDVEGQVPAAAAALRAAASEADTLLLVTPEYNGTVPAPLKNAIDWLSRPFGAGALNGKPTAVVGTAFGQYGGVQPRAGRVSERPLDAAPASSMTPLLPPSRAPRSLREEVHPLTTPRSWSRSRASSRPSKRPAPPTRPNLPCPGSPRPAAGCRGLSCARDLVNKSFPHNNKRCILRV